jgi:outer membrane biosynthesis protein TonB
VNKEQITFLMTVGFSMDEIMQMQNPSHDPQPAPQPDPEPAPQPDPQPEPAQQPNQTEQQIRQLTQAVADLTALVRKNNITGMQFGAPQPERSVDDILAEIINPPGKHLKGGTQ